MTIDELNDQVKDLRARLAKAEQANEVMRQFVNRLSQRILQLETRNCPPGQNYVAEIIDALNGRPLR